MLLDPEAVLIEYLRTQPVWTALAERISAGPNLPTGYRPAQGAAILLSLRSMSQDYSRGVAPAIVQFTTYAFDAVTVRAAEKKLYESLNDKSSPKMLGCFFRQTSGLGQTPDGNWWFAISLYNCQFFNKS